MVKWKDEPCPTALSTQILPPCISTICLTIVRPRPVPGIDCAAPLRTRRSRSRDRLHEQVVDVDVRRAHGHPTRLHAVQVEHVADQPVDSLRVVEYVAAIGPHLIGLEAAVADELAEALDACQRSAKLVADD